MRIKSIFLCLVASLALTMAAQPTQQKPEWEWYLAEVVDETFVGRNYFEYYYTPSAADMAQQRERGEVTYFLNSTDGLNSKKVRDKIDQLMASYDDIKAVSDWHMTNTTYWKEFRYEKNRFRFSVKRKALDDGTYYVSVTETAGYYKSLGKKDKQQSEAKPKSRTTKRDKASGRSTRDRKPVVVPDDDESPTSLEAELADGDEQDEAPVLSAKEQRKLEAKRRENEKRELRAKQRREQEKQRAEAKAQKKAEKLKKEEEKKKRQEEERLKREEKKRLREQERQRDREERAARRQQQEASTKQQTTQTPQQATPAESHFHHDDVALWLSEKYEFPQTAATDNGCTMYSSAVKDTEMAKLAIKNALKGSNARMAVPWRVNSDTQALETGYTVDGHVLVFTIGKDEQERVTLTITEVSGEQFELFKQGAGF